MKIIKLKHFYFLTICFVIITSCQNEQNWTEEDYRTQYRECANSFNKEHLKYENLISSCCSCSVDKIHSVMTKKEYKELANKPREIQLIKIQELTGECLNNFQIDLVTAKLRSGNLIIPIDSSIIDSLNVVHN
jgi:hypothetical protein